jgi:hypothetical protein
MKSLQSPLVTVVVAAKGSPYLSECLASVNSQSLTALEVLVSDKDLSLPENVARLLQLGNSPYVTILRDQDLLLFDALVRRATVLEQHPKVGLVHSAFRLVSENDEVLSERENWAKARHDLIESGPEFIYRAISQGRRINLSSVMVRRSILAGEGFDADGKPALELDIWLRLARRASVAYIHDSLVSHRVTRRESPTGGVAEVETRYRAVLRFLTRFGDEFPQRRELRVAARRWARLELVAGAWRAGRPDWRPMKTLALLTDAMRIEPTFLGSPRAWRLMLVSLAGAARRAAG